MMVTHLFDCRHAGVVEIEPFVESVMTRDLSLEDNGVTDLSVFERYRTGALISHAGLIQHDHLGTVGPVEIERIRLGGDTLDLSNYVVSHDVILVLPAFKG